MSETSRYANLSNVQMAELHAQCERFELTLQTDQAACLEECLASAPAELQDVLFQELLAIELEWRLPDDSWPHHGAYRARFPNRHRDIERVIAEVSKVWLAKQQAAPALMPPSAIHQFEGRYRLEREIARGGMGVIFRGSDIHLQRELAIKVLADEHKDNPEVVQRFIKEAQIGGQLQHPGIAPVYELGQFADSRPFFSMKLVQGQTLSMLLAARETVTEERAKFLGIFLKVCQTVAYAHEQGVIHRDLKPLNIMVGAFGEVQVMDWGLAKLLPSHQMASGQANALSPSTPTSPQSTLLVTPPATPITLTPLMESTHTQMGSVMGTPAYMAPEQARGQVSQLDQRVDVFGLGAILCEILTGLPPYTGKDRAQTFQLAVAGGLSDCYSRLDAAVEEPDLCAIAKASLQADRVLRIRDANVLAKQLSDYLESVDLKLRANEVARAADLARLEQQKRSASRLFAMVIVLAVVAGVAVMAATVAGKSWEAANVAKLKAESSEDAMRRSEAAEKRAAVTANSLRIEAESNLTKAELAEKNAIAHRERADRAADTTQQNLYFAEMHLAQQAWREHRGLLKLRDVLDNWLPSQDSLDRRGWEWFYLSSLPDQNQTTLVKGGEVLQRSALAWHAPSNRLAEGQQDGTIQIRTGKMGQILLTLRGPEPEIPFWGRTWFAWSGDGSQLAAGGRDGTVHVWETQTGQLLQVLKGLDAPVGTLAFHSDGQSLVAWTQNTSIRSWDLRSSTITNNITQPADTNVVVWSPDEQLFASGHSDGRITISKADTGEAIASWPAHIDLIYHLQWSPDGSRIASTSANDFFVTIWDVASQKKVVGPLHHSHGITAMAWEPGGNRLATGSMDETIKIWDTPLGVEEVTLRGHGHAVLSIAWGTDNRLASVDDWAGFKIWHTIHDQQAVVLAGDSRVSTVTWSPEGNELAAGSDDGKLTLWDTLTRQSRLQFKAHQERQGLVLPSGQISSVAWSPDGKLLASSSMDGTALVSRAADGEEVYRLGPTHGPLWSIAWNPAGTKLAIGADDGTLLLLNGLAETVQVETVTTPHSRIRSVAWNPAGDRLAMGGAEGMVTLWDATQKVEIQQLHGHEGTVTDVAWSPDGQRLATGGTDNLAMVWDVASATSISTMRGHSTWIEGITWSPSGDRIASAGMDSTVRIWDSQTGKEALVLHGDYGRFHDVSWHPSGAQIAAASGDGQIWIWDAAGESTSTIDTAN